MTVSVAVAVSQPSAVLCRLKERFFKRFRNQKEIRLENLKL